MTKHPARSLKNNNDRATFLRFNSAEKLLQQKPNNSAYASLRAAVTGANGHLGSTLCQALLQQGASVQACVRPKALRAWRGTLSPRLQVCPTAQLSDEAALIQAFHGCDVVFHTAAPTALVPADAIAAEAAICEGTLSVIKAAHRAGVRRVIYTSSCAAVGFHSRNGQPLDENNFNENTQHPQFRGKVRAEREGATLAAQLGMSFIRVCPPSILGPGFIHATPSTSPYEQWYQGKLRIIPDFCYHILDVRDLVAAQLLLATAVAPQQRYIVAGPWIEPAQLLNILSTLHTQHLPSIISSRWLGLLYCVDWLMKMIDRTHQRSLSWHMLKELRSSKQLLCVQRFCKDFPEWQPRTAAETLRATLQWIALQH